jgi:hypothetical protein
MKTRFSSINLLFLFLGIQVGFSQPFSDRNYTKSLPENVKAFAAKCNQTLLGKNAFVFDPSMNMKEVQTLIDSIFAGQVYPMNEFSENRYALLFKPGTYHLDVRVGYYMHIMGLGNSPEDVVIVGAVRSNASQGHSLCNFWRTVENLTIVPAIDSTNTWSVSQAAPLRRVLVKGNLKLFDGGSSGGFMADCKIEGTVFSGSQQQWLTRNAVFEKWDGGVWNMVYVGVTNAPKENWPDKPVTTIIETPEVREKPYLIYSRGKFSLKIPAMKKNSTGIDWNDPKRNEKTISIDDFYITNPGLDNAKSINKALNKGKHILFSPGIYLLSESLKITHSTTIMLGLGMATLVPEKGNKVVDVSDVDGVTIAGLLIDAASIPSETLMQVGAPGSKENHEVNPTCLFDLFFRIGGPHEGSASHCLEINSNNVFVDHAWFWRADHGTGIGWDKSKCANGLIVNGDNVTIYGLFNEHFQEYQTIWNGEKGRVYFYQSEMPYDVPSLEAWKHDGIYGYASYKVGSNVKNHQAWGIGIYGFFDIPIVVDQAIETPKAVENGFYHKVLVLLGWNKPTNTVVKSVINGKGGELNTKIRKITME